MNILITGASGFVGSNLSKYLSSNGYLVDSLDIVKNGSPFIRDFYLWSELEGINFNLYDAVIHLAGKAHDVRGKSGSEIYFNVNTGLTKVVFDKFLNSEAGSFIFFSSVMGVADVVDGDVLTEVVVPAPVCPDGESKMLAENYILEQSGEYAEKMKHKRFYILRPCMIHGPGNKGNLNLLYKVVSKGVPWPLGQFENLRSFTFIRNLEFIIEKLMVGDIESGVYNVCDDVPLSTNRLIELIGDSLGKRASVWNLSSGFVKGVAKIGDYLHLPLNSLRLQKLSENYVVSNAKIKAALGIDKLPVSSEDGMVETLKSFRNG
ncbi:MAG: NAD-dependent epimerase/dehydratase family protein [Bacteroidales bacterium]|nr:NAD-dependent epimerase/dehydratase family protein [Bacteroidales bacterium]